jgi:CRP-like cAMP-binding protein
MAEQLLDRILREIRERLRESRAAYEESRRLEAALAALDRESVETEGDAPEPSSAPRPPRPRAGRARAPRGANLSRIREAVEQRPGVTAGEVAAATGIARPTVASTLGKLVRGGELERTTLPSGGIGFRKTRAPTGETTAGSEPETTTSHAPQESGGPDEAAGPEPAE